MPGGRRTALVHFPEVAVCLPRRRTQPCAASGQVLESHCLLVVQPGATGGEAILSELARVLWEDRVLVCGDSAEPSHWAL